jgi:putative ABC transport system ATP-binding protein
MNEHIIQSVALRRTFRKGDHELRALDDVSFTIEKGSFLSIVGKSGSGKSTLLNLLGGLDTPTEGELLYFNKKINSMSRQQLALYRRKSVGMVFQSFNLIKSLNAADNVRLALTFGRYPKAQRNIRVNELLQQVGLDERMDHKPSELSGGESQRVAIARALANDPGILLADEPTGNLDTITSEEIMNLIFDLNRNQGLTVIMVTHDMEIAEKYSTRIIRLKDGNIIEDREVT